MKGRRRMHTMSHDDENLLDALQRGETVDMIVDHLRRGILNGQYAPGQRLISRDLMNEIGVSRGPVREAFGRLSADGLIELTPNRGAAVKRFTRREIKNVFQIREMLEGLAASLAARQIGADNNRKRLQEMQEMLGGISPGDTQAFMNGNRLFHRLIVDMSTNPELGVLIDRMALPIMMVQLRRLMSEDDLRCSRNEHDDILSALFAGDPEEAEKAMRRHLRQSAQRFMRLPPSAFSD